MIKQLPNFLTLLNLVFGCCAIVMLLQNGIQIVAADPSPENPLGQRLEFAPSSIYLAPLFILLAAVADFFDGFVARLVGAAGDMGKQLDSLADVVSFGVAPSMIVYQFLRMSLAGREDGLETSFVWLTPAFVIAAAAAWRLARFNLQNNDVKGFRGVPVPMTGLAFAGFPLVWWTTNSATTTSLLTSPWFWYATIALAAWAMVSTWPVVSNKPTAWKFPYILPQVIFVTAVIITAITVGWWALPVSFVLIIVVSLLFKKQIAS